MSDSGFSEQVQKWLTPKRFSSHRPVPARRSPRNVRGFILFSLWKIKETLVKLSTFLHGIPIPNGVWNRQFKSTNFYTEFRRQTVPEYNAHVILLFAIFQCPQASEIRWFKVGSFVYLRLKSEL